MTYYRQNDSRWRYLKIWGTDLTLGSFGCFITSLGNLCGKTPPEVNQILGENGCIVNGLLANPTKIASLLGLEYGGIAYKNPGYTCIAETLDFDKAATPEREQHFFNVFADGSIFDPLGLRSSYNIKSYRLYKRSNMSIVWQPGQDIKFNPDQAKRLYEIIGRREPENEAATQNRGWDLIEGLNIELESILRGRDSRVNDLVGELESKKAEIFSLNSRIAGFAHNEEILHEEIDARAEEVKTLTAEVARLHKIWDGHKCETKELSISDHLLAIYEYVKQLLKRK